MIIDFLISDDCKTLMARGEHSKDAIISAALEQGEIEEYEVKQWENGEYSINYYHTTPRKGYNAWYSVSKEGVRGAFKASVIYILQ